ncbi:hypothetical protein DBR37_01705 [Herminiimonas sp. KBW02]|nr:hypothetical protein DBR37_01705 [Herminiimonas sp. KBW02]
MSDTEIDRLADDIMLKTAFSSIPKWQCWAIGIFIFFGLGIGLNFINTVIDRTGYVDWLQFAIGCLTVFAFVRICQRESSHRKLQNALREEIEKRSN